MGGKKIFRSARFLFTLYILIKNVLNTEKFGVPTKIGELSPNASSATGLAWVVFTSDGKRNKATDTGIGKANAVLREFYSSVVTKQEFSKTAKLSVFKSVCCDLHLRL